MFRPWRRIVPRAPLFEARTVRQPLRHHVLSQERIGLRALTSRAGSGPLPLSHAGDSLVELSCRLLQS